MTTFVADMHFEALAGTGWTSGDFGNVSVHTITSDTGSGYVLPVSDNFGLNVGVLAAYQAADGEWYSFKIVSSSPTQIGSDRPLEPTLLGGKISNVYYDNAHPNINGGAAIVDASLRSLAHGRVQELERKQREPWVTFGTASISYAPVAAYTYPGSDISGERAAVVSGSSVGGVVSTQTALYGGEYVVELPVSTGVKYGSTHPITIGVEELTAGVWATVANETYEGINAVLLAKVSFETKGDKPIRVRVSGSGGAPWSFSVGQIAFLRVFGDSPNFDTGKHVVLADSWGTPSSPIVSRLISRLSNATIISKGVGGNRSDQLIARFNTDVTPQSPNFVWVIVGTNDFYQGVTSASFEANITALRNLILGIGATPIFLTPSVGALTYSPPQMFPSRRYEAYVRYHDFASDGPVIAAPWRVVTVERTVNVDANSSTPVITLPGDSASPSFVTYMAGDNASLTIKLGTRIFNGGFTYRKCWAEQPTKSPVVLMAKNSTATPQTITIIAEILWRGDLS